MAWDITKLPTHSRGVYLNLYLILDLYSRYVVGWMISRKENAGLAKHLFAHVLTAHAINQDTLTVHSDRGSPMTAHTFAELLGTMGVARSFSRPRVSNDNPFSESHFKTLKYTPDYPVDSTISSTRATGCAPLCRTTTTDPTKDWHCSRPPTCSPAAWPRSLRDASGRWMSTTPPTRSATSTAHPPSRYRQLP